MAAEAKSKYLVEEPPGPGPAPKPQLETQPSVATKLQSNLISLHERLEVATVTVKELLLYICFVVLFTVLVISTRGETQFWFNHQLKRMFSTVVAEDGTILEFGSINNDDYVWKYLESAMPLLYEEEWYNGEEYTDAEKGHLNWHNVLVGAIRLRQVRVGETGSCEMNELFQDAVEHCSPSFTEDVADTESFGPGGDAFEWTDLGQAAVTVEQGFSGPVYARGSYATFLPGGRGEGAYNVSQALDKLDYLKENLWIDERTRGVFMEFSVYNPGLNVFSVVRTAFEFRNTGVVTPYATFRVVQVREILFSYQSFSELVLTGLEAILVLLVLRYVLQELQELREEKRKGDWQAYFRMAWNYYDWLNIFCFLGMFYLRYVAYTKALLVDLQPEHMSDPTRFFDLQSLGYDLNLVKSLNALNSVLCWFKLFKYLELSPRMSQLTRTLNRASSELSSFFFMFLIVFWGFSLGFYSAFGADIADFKSIFFCIFSLFRTILGDFDFAAMEANKRYLGPLLFVLYIALVFFVLMNMFLAIINGAYQQTYEDLKRRGNDPAGDMLLRVVSEKLRWRNKRKNADARRKLAVVHAAEEQAEGAAVRRRGSVAVAGPRPASPDRPGSRSSGRPGSSGSEGPGRRQQRPGSRGGGGGRMGPPIAEVEGAAPLVGIDPEKAEEMDGRIGRLESDVAAMASMMEGLAVTLEKISQQQQALLRGDPSLAM